MTTNETTAPEEGRDYLRLLTALDAAIDILASDGDQEEALRDSFEAAAEGFGAKKALLLVVDPERTPPLRNIRVRGLSAAQVNACERGESIPGVSATMIKDAIASGRAQIREHPLDAAAMERTASTQEGHYSAICGPILDRVTKQTIAVIYFQNPNYNEAYRQAALTWLDTYTKTIGRFFGVLLQQKRREKEIEGLVDGRARPETAADLVGESSHTYALRRELHEHYIEAAEQVRPLPVLIVGEKGTGKEQVARYVHAYSARRQKPFIAVNCGELTPEMTVARLFGHLRGAFTGADRDRPGFFQAAQGGVLFIDEIDELSLEGQGALKRALDKFTLTPVGGQQAVPFDIYVMLATNQELPQLIQEKRFKADLYDRFAVQTIALRPLRERPLDIKPLLEHFLREWERRARKPTLGFTDEALRGLLSYSWSGNVRELEHLCSALVTRAKRGQRIDRELIERVYPKALSVETQSVDPTLWRGLTMKEAIRDLRKELILVRLEQHSGNHNAVMESLGLSRTVFYQYLKLFGLSKARGKAGDGDAGASAALEA